MMIRTFTDMKISRLLFGLMFILNMTSCTSKKEEVSPIQLENHDKNLTPSQTIVLKPVDESVVKIKNQAQVFRFLASLENEILKLIIPASLPSVNQFDVLSYAFDLQAQIKRPSLKSYECQKIKLKGAEKKITIVSECEKPFKTLAEIDVLTEKLYVIRFINASWSSVVGLSATLQTDPRECVVKLKANRPLEMECTNTTYTLKADSHLQDLRIKKYSYKSKKETKDSNEVAIEAAIYKDFIEIKKIKMTVPFFGQIKIIEKEIEVKDDYANLNNPPAPENGLEYKEEHQNESTSEAQQPSR